MFLATWDTSMPMPISSRQFWPSRSSKCSTVTGQAFAVRRAARELRQRTSRASATLTSGGSPSIGSCRSSTEDISKLHEKGVPVYAVQDDLEERGIDRGNCLTCVQVIPRTEIAHLLEEHDQIWHW